MTLASHAAAGLCLRADLRSRWRGWAAVALLLGVAAGAVAAAAAGARRTDSAADRFAREYRAYDAVVPNVPDPGVALYDADAIERLPMVRAASRIRIGFTTLRGIDAALVTRADDPAHAAVNRPKVIEGRLADPTRVDEVTVSVDLAERADARVGDVVRDLSPEARVDEATIVGIVAYPGELAQEQPAVLALHGTPALHRRLAAATPGVPDGVLVALARGAADVPSFRAAVRALADPGPEQAPIDARADSHRRLVRSNHLQAVALSLLAIVLAIAAAMVVGPLVSRAVASDARNVASRRAVGMTARDELWLVGLRGAVVGAAAVPVAVAVAVLASTLAPTGLARVTEPDPGFYVDGLVLACAAAALVAFAVVVAVVPAAVSRPAPRRAAPRARLAERVAPVLPVPAAMGMRLAARGTPGARAGLFGVGVGFVALVAALGYSASLRHLLAEPELYGWRWDLAATNYGTIPPGALDPGTPEGFRAVRSTPGVASAAVGSMGGYVEIDGHEVGLLALDVVEGDPRDVLPPVVRGRPPVAPGEIALGASTLADLDAEVGDTLDVEYSGVTAPMTVVGTVVLPPFGLGVELDRGALVPNRSSYDLFGVDVETLGDEQGAIGGSIFVRLEPGTDPAPVFDALEDAFGEHAPGYPALYRLDRPEPNDLVNFARVRNLPTVFAAVVGALSGGTLLHVVVTTLRRRRRELATVKALGMTRRQLWASVVVFTSAVVAATVAVSVPTGAVLARLAWSANARALGFVDVFVVRGSVIAAAVAGAFTVAYLLAALPARSVARLHPATALRAE